MCYTKENSRLFPENQKFAHEKRIGLSSDAKNVRKDGNRYGIWTRVAAVEGRCPRPLDEPVVVGYRSAFKRLYSCPQPSANERLEYRVALFVVKQVLVIHAFDNFSPWSLYSSKFEWKSVQMFLTFSPTAQQLNNSSTAVRQIRSPTKR